MRDVHGVVPAEPAPAAWKAGNPDVARAVADARAAGALAAVNGVDRAAIRDEHAAFTASLADDLVVNNPQNGVSVRGATRQRSTAGQISYVRYDRVIQYAGMRGDMVLLMGKEVVQPRALDEVSAQLVYRRFSDLWELVAGTGSSPREK